MLNQFLSNVIWVDFKTKRVLYEQPTKVQKIPYLCQLKKGALQCQFKNIM